MKRVRVAVQPDRSRAPSFVEHLLDSPAVSEARATDWNRGDADVSTHLYAVDGDAATFVERAADTSGVDSVSLSAADGTVSHALLELRDDAVPIFGGTAAAIDRPGLVVRRPLVYRDGRIYGEIVGDPDVLQSTLDGTPETVDVQIEQIGQYPGASGDPASTLSERQQEAIDAALELGYYDVPRGATHEDVGDELGCAPNTATEHLQRGEAKLVRFGTAGFDAGR